jgi:RNA polymerase sigma factor (TIGR02999 family)
VLKTYSSRAMVYSTTMTDVTNILSQIEQGDPSAAEQLLPLVYDELRKLAAAKLAIEKPGQTLQATALVHDAYIRLVDVEKAQHWNSRGHFFGAAAEAMRRILIEAARHKKREKHGGDWNRVDLDDLQATTLMPPDDLIALSDAIDVLAEHDLSAAKLTKLRCFAGFSVEEAADTLGLSRTNAYRQWAYAKAWLFSRVRDDPDSP